ncbi:hypothetical protein [Promicromonospora sukumoe]
MKPLQIEATVARLRQHWPETFDELREGGYWFLAEDIGLGEEPAQGGGADTGRLDVDDSGLRSSTGRTETRQEQICRPLVGSENGSQSLLDARCIDLVDAADDEVDPCLEVIDNGGQMPEHAAVGA